MGTKRMIHRSDPAGTRLVRIWAAHAVTTADAAPGGVSPLHPRSSRCRPAPSPHTADRSSLFCLYSRASRAPFLVRSSNAGGEPVVLRRPFQSVSDTGVTFVIWEEPGGSLMARPASCERRAASGQRQDALGARRPWRKTPLASWPLLSLRNTMRAATRRSSSPSLENARSGLTGGTPRPWPGLPFWFSRR
jgi:hypothetical protein